VPIDEHRVDPVQSWVLEDCRCRAVRGAALDRVVGEVEEVQVSLWSIAVPLVGGRSAQRSLGCRHAGRHGGIVEPPRPDTRPEARSASHRRSGGSLKRVGVDLQRYSASGLCHCVRYSLPHKPESYGLTVRYWADARRASVTREPRPPLFTRRIDTRREGARMYDAIAETLPAPLDCDVCADLADLRGRGATG
jgi:hypothetical protein